MDANKSGGIRFIESWYASNCDGDWEHEFAIRIETIDNPGWHLEIDVAGTDLEGVVVDDTLISKPEGSWMSVSSDGRTFDAVCGELSLGLVDDFFRELSKRNMPVVESGGENRCP